MSEGPDWTRCDRSNRLDVAASTDRIRARAGPPGKSGPAHLVQGRGTKDRRHDDLVRRELHPATSVTEKAATLLGGRLRRHAGTDRDLADDDDCEAASHPLTAASRWGPARH